MATMLLLLPLLLRLCVVVSSSVSNPHDVIDFFFDDGYYYLTVAANLVDLGRSTFDGLTSTNGYQPLWLLVLAGLARTVGTEPRTLFVASCALIYTLACLAPLSALWWWRSAASSTALCVGCGLALIIIQQPLAFIDGLEPILIVVLAVPLIMTIERETLDSKALLTLSALLACAFLMRLDSLSLFISSVVSLPLFEVVTGRLPRQSGALLRRYIQVGAILSSFVVPTVIVYLVVNRWLFGSAVPVSGIAKLVGAPKFSNLGAYGMFFSRWKSVGLLLVLLLPLELTTRRVTQEQSSVFYRSFVIFVLALVIQSSYYAAFSAWGIWPWYTYLAAIATALLTSRILYLASVCFSYRIARFVAAITLIVIGAWAINRSATLALSSLSPERQAGFAYLRKFGLQVAEPSEETTANQVTLHMLNDFFQPNHRTLIAMGDRAGGLAFWGRKAVSIVQTEGLLLDSAYFKARASNQGAAYLERFPIEYFVVDREVVATAPRADGQLQYVIPDPIQGRINTSPVPTFCFPASAKRYESTYSTFLGINTRIAFAFAEREACGRQAIALMRTVETGIGLRQFSLPGEYRVAQDGANLRSEDRDRRFGARLSSR